jgi:hypothetical protein
MIPRDFMTASLEDPDRKKQIMDTLRVNLHDMVVNFKGIPTRPGPNL